MIFPFHLLFGSMGSSCGSRSDADPGEPRTPLQRPAAQAPQCLAKGGSPRRLPTPSRLLLLRSSSSSLPSKRLPSLRCARPPPRLPACLPPCLPAGLPSRAPRLPLLLLLQNCWPHTRAGALQQRLRVPSYGRAPANRSAGERSSEPEGGGAGEEEGGKGRGSGG